MHFQLQWVFGQFSKSPFVPDHNEGKSMTLRQTMRRSVFERAVGNLRNFYRFKISRRSLAITCLGLAGLIGYIDYLTGYEHSMLLFYFLPISLAAWFANFRFGIMMVAL